MSDLQRNPFVQPMTSWTRAFLYAVGIEVLLSAAVLWSYALSSGADNSLALYIGLILPFPGSLFFGVVLRVASSFVSSDMVSTAVAATVVVLVQATLLTLAIGRPWRP